MDSLQQVINQFLARSRRDQIMLLILAIAIVLYLVYQLVLTPLADYRDQQQLQLRALQESHGRVKVLAAQVNANKGSARPQSSGGSLAQQVDISLRQNGLVMQGLQSGANGEVRLRLQDAEYGRLLQWLHTMEVENGVQLVNLSVVAANQPGRVIANIRLRKG